MRKSVVLFMLAVLTSGAVAQFAFSEPQPAEPGRHQKVVVHLSHFTDDLHRCFMALKLATLMQKSGAEVTLFLDLEGVRLAERRQRLDMTWGSSATTLSEHYENFINAEGKVVLCAHCANSARIGDPALKRNAEIGTEDRMAKMLLEADKLLDY